ncbi:efflux RND transporter permease subunit [Joostella atrarenae]|uniref:Efflux RND transporter permease subunit n=1 Tax=Joostella atrarenae TaxID=679257 RepID=A0ABS9J7F4_9FLAO|nr:efflux RND transporter permease subunit [Joostella atrarenae]MCF8716339.1 efflux RND transporter permease subunit [Joostella atrarenae]
MNGFSPFRIIITFVSLSLIGLFLLPKLNYSLEPKVNYNAIQITYHWSNVSPEIIEKEVTAKLEGLLNNIKGIKNIRSRSEKGNGVISIEFKDDINIDASRFEASTIIRQSYDKLPLGVSYPEISVKSNEGNNQEPILVYSINSKENSIAIKKYVKSNIIPKLNKLNGLSRIETHGTTQYEWVIKYDESKINKLNLSVHKITTAIKSYMEEIELGRGVFFIKDNLEPYSVNIRLKDKFSYPFVWEEIPVLKLENRIILLGEIASINLKELPPQTIYRINGENTVNVLIYPDDEANIIKLASEIKSIMGRLESYPTERFEITLDQDRTKFLKDELDTIKNRTIFSLLILIALSILIYRNFKYLIILMLSIVMNLLVAIILYFALDVDVQLYSLAGVTISFGIIIDNSIIMLDHIKRKGNKKIFLAILAATLTTISSVILIVLLDKNQKEILWDFALVIIINLGVSIFISLYLIPALAKRVNLDEEKKTYTRKFRKNIVSCYNFYHSILLLLNRKWINKALIFLAILVFGIPLHLAPEKVDEKGWLSVFYNQSIGSSWFINARPYFEEVIGGSFKLFSENVFENSNYHKPERTRIKIHAAIPDGGNIFQLNMLIEEVEKYLSQFKQIDLFETHIRSYNDGELNIFFEKEYEESNFPYFLKDKLESLVLKLGGVEWAITGVGMGFSNSGKGNYRSNIIYMRGYNYDELYKYSERLKKVLLANSNDRVKDIEINSGQRYGSTEIEYFLTFNREKISLYGLSQLKIYNALEEELGNIILSPKFLNNELQKVRLISTRYNQVDIWKLKNYPIEIDGLKLRLGDLTHIIKKKSEEVIQKNNQEYEIAIIYNFRGPNELADTFSEEIIKQFSQALPIGYKVFKEVDGWNKNEPKQYYLILVIILVIFLICCCLFESLKQSIAIVSVIPISFIGVFLIFYIFNFNFDQGGYASFILLSGLTVNSAIFITNEFNVLRNNGNRVWNSRLYLKAFNRKIIPILITIITTISGLLPFIWDGQNEVFWFSFAIGSIGGVLFSLIGILIFLPIFLKYSCERKLKRSNSV